MVLTGTGISGTVTFTETGDGVLIEGKIQGLEEGLHGFHVHALGDLSDGCTSTKGHFNPENVCISKFSSSGPVTKKGHFNHESRGVLQWQFLKYQSCFHISKMGYFSPGRLSSPIHTTFFSNSVFKQQISSKEAFHLFQSVASQTSNHTSTKQLFNPETVLIFFDLLLQRGEQHYKVVRIAQQL